MPLILEAGCDSGLREGLAAAHAVRGSGVPADPSVRSDGDGPVFGHLRVVAAQLEPGLAAGAGDVAGLVFFGSATALVQVDDVHASSVDYAECRSQGEPVNDLLG